MTATRLRLAGFVVVGVLLVLAAAPFVQSLVSPIVNPLGSSLKDWTCADQTRGKASFCVTLPPPSPQDQVAWNIGQEVTAARISLMAQAHGIALQSVPMTWGDLWVEDKVPQETRRLLSETLDGDLARIGGDFGRPFSVRPKIITFANAGSFEKGMTTLFGYPPVVARALAANNGGALVIPLRSIAVNWSTLTNERPLTILRHELAHAMIREITGASPKLPAWFDEGLATMEQNSWTLSEDDRYIAGALQRGGKAPLAQLSDANDWIRLSGTLGGRNYPVAAVAVDVLKSKVGVGGVSQILDQVSRGTDFETAFTAVANTSLAAFAREFPELARQGAPAKVTTSELTTGEVRWVLKGAVPGTTAHVTVDGRDVTYHLVFDVQVDENGQYMSTFGATAPAGTYFVQVVAGDAEVSATLRVRKG